jgi:hypothetical protein
MLDHRRVLSCRSSWAAGVPVPGYAIDDQTAIKVTDGTVEVVSEGTGNCSPLRPRALRQEMGVFGCSSIRGVCNADIGCGAKTLRWASVAE